MNPVYINGKISKRNQFKSAFIRREHQFFQKIKMKPLKLIQKYLILIGIFKLPTSAPWYLKYRNAFIGLYIFFTTVSIFVSTILFEIRFWSIDLASSVFSIKQAAAVLSVFYTMVAMFMYPEKLVSIFDRFQAISDECEL